MLGWLSLITAVLNWLSETPAQKQNSSTPGYLAVGMALMAVGVVSGTSAPYPFYQSLYNLRRTCHYSSRLLLPQTCDSVVEQRHPLQCHPKGDCWSGGLQTVYTRNRETSRTDTDHAEVA